MSAQPRNLAVFLDGTWNTLNDNTNVWRLKSLCEQSDRQKLYYSVGVGTSRGERLTGGAFGIGIDEEVMNAYEWLVENYQSDPGDRIFIFGFSRGAFTARSLAGFISKCGLLRPGSPMSLNQLYKRYRHKEGDSVRQLAKRNTADLKIEERWLVKYSRPIPIWFQGVWDTVGTLGVPLPWFAHISCHDFEFLETDLRINDTFAFHALAIDEHRDSFKPTLWRKTTNKVGDSLPPRDWDHVEQRWFAGAHSNVGGGYEDDLLAQAPLQWIGKKAVKHGLILKDTIDKDDGMHQCPIRDSLAEMAHGLYEIVSLGQRYYRPIGPASDEDAVSITNNINESVDASVFERMRAVPDYRPQNVVDWAAQFQGCDPLKITSSVKAREPSVIIPD